MRGPTWLVAAACLLCAAASATPRRAAGEDFSAEELERGVRCVDQRCQVQQALADKAARWLRAGGHAASFARVQPVLDRGEGVKLYAIRPGSLFARLGLRNGDVVLAVDGTGLRAGRVRPALEAVAGRRQHSVSIEREGAPVALEIAIVPTLEQP